LVLFFGGIELYGPGYPHWRHIVMILIDVAIAVIAAQQSAWLVVALLAFLAEQLTVNGLGLTSFLVLIAAIAAGRENWNRRTAGN
jgi:hypothetical protein